MRFNFAAVFALSVLSANALVTSEFSDSLRSTGDQVDDITRIARRDVKTPVPNPGARVNCRSRARNSSAVRTQFCTALVAGDINRDKNNIPY